jgi:hypothetical protein
MPTTKSGKVSKSRSTSKGTKAAKASRKSAAKSAKKKTTTVAKAATKKGATGSKKSLSQKKATKRTIPKAKAKKSASQPGPKGSVGIVAKAKSVLKPVLAGAAAAAAVIAGKNPDSVEREQSVTSPKVAGEASQTENAEEPTPNPQRLRDGVLIDRRR